MTGVSVREDDLDYDGHGDVLVQTRDVSLLLHPRSGGMLSELDFRQRNFALLDVLARRREAYHQALIEGTVGEAHQDLTSIHGGVRLKEAGLAESLVFDRCRRGALQEWIVSPETGAAAFASGSAQAWIEPAGEWEHEVSRADDGASVRLSREQDGWRIQKRVDVPARGERVRVRYEITNASAEHRAARFVSEWNVSPPHAPDGDDRIAVLKTSGARIDLSQAPGEVAGTAGFVVRGSAPFGIGCNVEGDPCDVWHFPVKTVSSSEGGLELVTQGVSISAVCWLDLEPGASRSLALSWRVTDS